MRPVDFIYTKSLQRASRSHRDFVGPTSTGYRHWPLPIFPIRIVVWFGTKSKMKLKIVFVFSSALFAVVESLVVQNVANQAKPSTDRAVEIQSAGERQNCGGSTRRAFFDSIIALAVGATIGTPIPSLASENVAVVAKGNMPDLPPDTVRSYLQYRIPLQTSADYYTFELRDKLTKTAEWYAP